MRLNKKLLKISLLVVTLLLFALYFSQNKATFARISDLSAVQLLLILLGQGIVLIANTITLIIIVSFFNKRIHTSDAARVTAYSSLINFFGFLQGGVGFRGIYLKRYFAIPLKMYALATTLQYVILFTIAGILIVLGLTMTQGIAYTLLFCVITLVVIAIGGLVIYKTNVANLLFQRFADIGILVSAKNILLLTGSLGLQLCGSLLAYGVALQAIGANLTLGGLLVYTGITQFSIVVALTPGALGIREALLLLVQNQMLLSANDIIVASTIDRMVYFITLLLTVPLALGARNRIAKTKPAKGAR